MRSLTLCAIAFFAISPLLAQKEIQNGRAHQGLTLKLEELVRFGGDNDDPNFVWGALNSSIALTIDGKILVGDPNTNETRLYDQNGRFLRLVAGKGQGPGETSALNSINRLRDGRTVIFEKLPGVRPRFLYFDRELNFTSAVNPAVTTNLPGTAEISPTGELFAGLALTIDGASNTIINRSGIFNKDCVFIKEFSSFSQTADLQNLQKPEVLSGFLGGFLASTFKGLGIFAFADDGTVFTALSTAYQITRWSPDMKQKELVFGRQYKPIQNDEAEVYRMAERLTEVYRAGGLAEVITDNFLKQVVTKAEVPEVKNPIQEMVAMPDGYLLVVHNMVETTGVQTADIFDKNGLYVGQVVADNWPFIGPNRGQRLHFFQDRAITLETDKDENNWVVIYRWKLEKA